MVGNEGVEPSSGGFRDRCLSTWLIPNIKFSGSERRDRTADILINSEALLPTELSRNNGPFYLDCFAGHSCDRSRFVNLEITSSVVKNFFFPVSTS